MGAVGRVEVAEAVRGGEAHGPGGVLVCRSVAQEDRDAGDKQRLRKTLDDAVEEGAEVGLCVEAATEVDEGLTVVEALLIEDAIDAALDGAFERVEDQAGDGDGGDQAPDA